MPEIDENCKICKVQDNANHIIFNCNLSKHIWNKVGQALNLQIQIKNIILNEYNDAENETLTTVTYLLYKYWIEITNNRSYRSNEEIDQYMKKNLICHSKILEFRNRNQEAGNAQKIANIL